MIARLVVVGHRDRMVAEGLAAALGRWTQIVPLEPATTVKETEARARGADAVALDRALPGAHHAAQRIRRRGVRVVFIGDHDGDEGVSVTLDNPVSALAAALVPGSTDARRHKSLTPREDQILKLVASGLACKQVAQQLGISPKTVEQHKSRIFAKLGVPNQTAAVSLTLSNGIRLDREWREQ